MHHWLGGWTPLFGSWLGQKKLVNLFAAFYMHPLLYASITIFSI